MERLQAQYPDLWSSEFRATELECAKDSLAVINTRFLYQLYVYDAQIKAQNDFIESDYTRMCQKTYEYSLVDGKMEFSVRSCDYDDFSHIHGVEWDGAWLESLPGQAGFAVPRENTQDAIEALTQLGFVKRDPPDHVRESRSTAKSSEEAEEMAPT